MDSLPAFLAVALAVTLTPGPATALLLRVAARDGRRAAFGALAGNSVGVLAWAGLSAVGVSSLIAASQWAYGVLRVGGAVVLITIGIRSLLRRRDEAGSATPAGGRVGWRTGVIAALANPKLAIFFVALLPQFLSPGAAVLPAALLMAVVIVAFDMLWFGTLICAVTRATALLRPRVRRVMELVTGGVLIGLGARLVLE